MNKKLTTATLVDLAAGVLSPEESLRVLDEIERDPEASREFEDIVRIMDIVARDGSVVFERSQARGVRARRRWLEWEMFPRWRPTFSAVALGAVVLLIAGIFSVRWLMANKYQELAEPGAIELEGSIRGAGAEDFAVASQWYAQGRYDDAIRRIERYIRAYPGGTDVDYAHLFAGALCLVSARRDYFALFPSSDRERVERGLNHLESALTSTQNVRIIEDARILRARGFLMLRDRESALKELTDAASMKGPKEQEARELIRDIESK